MELLENKNASLGMRNLCNNAFRMGYLKTSKQFGVPKTTVADRVKKIKKGSLELENSAKKGRRRRHTPVFSEYGIK